MPKPSGNEVAEFSYRHLWEAVASAGVAERLNVRVEFVDFLKAKGHPGIIAEEYAEKNSPLLLTNILKVCDQWEALGIPRPLDIVDQNGSIITWKHPKYERLTGRRPLSGVFCDVWTWVKNSHDRAFLFCCAAYLLSLGCTRIYITDTTGDAGLDLIGVLEEEPFRGLCVLVQAKTAHGQVSKEDVFSDYTKFVLLKHDAKWDEYRKAVGIDKTPDGVGLVYIFASNCEFGPSIAQAARNLPIMLRSGRQIAHCLAKRADATRWRAVQAHVGETNANLSRNLSKLLLEAL